MGCQPKVSDVNIEIVTEITYLGIFRDNKLKFSKPIDYLCKKIFKNRFFLKYRISSCLINKHR